ncbi:hypothetical protein LRS13_01745 [Svornostia abyssi]|uniref:MtN3 and saliva related transmembrane protein n=1 Tax=Svornostia abyssi TaxID=2898438 RepID=A0ABY5PI44_9ACTN|nr:hypothetical protein LRS13_01745 [Parviterribacteraceae bacterium J379]
MVDDHWRLLRFSPDASAVICEDGADARTGDGERLMDADALTAVAATTAGIVMGVAPLLQAERVHRRRHSDDVSAAWLVVLIVGGSVWLARGIVTDDLPIIIANVVVIVSSVFTLAVVLRYRGHDPVPASD